MWQFVDTLIVTGREWRFTPPIIGSSLFRIQHTTTADFYGRALIAQASNVLPLELFGVRKLYAKEEVDIYEFTQPDCWVDRRLAVRSYRRSTGMWQITIDVWKP